MELVNKDVILGYCLLISLDQVRRVKGTLMAPMNIIHQSTINKHRRIVEKDRLNHDQSYKWGLGTVVSSQVKKSELFLYMFGTCIRMIANWTVVTQRKYPNKRILASKINFKSAYQCCHLNHDTASQI